MLEFIKFCLSAFLIISVAPVYLLIWIVVQFVARIFGREWCVVVDDIMYSSYQRYLLFFLEVTSGVKVIIYGDFEEISNKRESVIMFSNHQCLVDWIVMSMLAERQASCGFMRFVLKQSLKFIPMYGFYFKQHGFIYVERSGRFDRSKYISQLDRLARNPRPIWVILFPEGHRYDPENIHVLNKMTQYAKDNDLPVYENLLTPRTKAFTSCVEELHDRIDAVYDVTLAFSSTLPELCETNKTRRTGPPSYLDLFKGNMTIHVDVKRIPMSEVPVDEGVLEKWLFQRYASKDELLSSFYSESSRTRGTFGAGGVTSTINFSKMIPTVIVYILCLLPWLLSWQSFVTYLLLYVVCLVFTTIVSSLLY